MTKWIWGAAAVLAGVGVYFFATRPTTTSPADLCIKDLPEPFKAQAVEIITKGDVPRMQSFSAQCDAKGWHCAAKELRTAAATVAEKANRSKMDILEVAKTASEPLRGKVGAVMALFVRPKIGSMTGMDYKTVTFAKKPTDADIKLIDDLAAALAKDGYATANVQMSNAAAAARDVKTIFPTEPAAVVAPEGEGAFSLAAPINPATILAAAGQSIVPVSNLPEPYASTVKALLASPLTKAATLRAVADEIAAAGYTGAAEDLYGRANILALKEAGGV